MRGALKLYQKTIGNIPHADNPKITSTSDQQGSHRCYIHDTMIQASLQRFPADATSKSYSTSNQHDFFISNEFEHQAQGILLFRLLG
jgi:hypothetical protein